MRRSTPGVFEPRSPEALPYPLEVLEAALEPLVLPERLERFTQVARARLGSVVVVLESLIDPYNAAAILRTADGFGVGEVHLIDRGVRPLLVDSITRGCERWMDLLPHQGTEGCARALKARGFELFVADARGALPLAAVAARARVALCFGNERDGASEALRAHAAGTFAIPMRGMVESFNVSVAAGIALHAVTQGRPGDLGPEGARRLRARFLLESVRRPQEVLARHLRDAPSARSAGED